MNDPYDPEETEGRRGNQYVTKKDFRLVLIVVVILAVVAWPIYIYLLGQVNSSLCNKNVKNIGEALLAYVRDNDDHLPFTYERAGYDTNEMAVHNGYAYTWQWAIEPYVTGGWRTFRCPAAQDVEHTKTADPTSGAVHVSDYGMLDGYSGLDWSTIPYPDQKVIIGETSNRGALNTYDPMPLMAGGVPLQYDGFEIGFNDSQDYPIADTVDDKGIVTAPGTRFATRLAYPNTSRADFDHESESRHPGGIHFLSAEGGLRNGDASTAVVIQLSGGFGLWDVPRPAPPLSPKPPKP